MFHNIYLISLQFKEVGVIGSSMEGHVSHVLSTRMNSRPMGKSRQPVQNKDILEKWHRDAKAGTDAERQRYRRKAGGRKKFECKRNSVMGKENQQSEWKIYRSTTGAYKQSDFRKIELLQCDRQYMLIG